MSNKRRKEFKAFIENNLKSEDTVKLSSVRELERCSEAVQDVLSMFYEDEDPNIQKLGSMLNAIYTQQTNAFMNSIRIMKALVKADSNTDLKDCHSSQYRKMMHLALRSGILSKLREPSGNTAGLYELTSKQFLSILEEEVGKDVLQAKKEAHIEWYDKSNQERRDKLKEAKNRIEKRRMSRKGILNNEQSEFN